MTSFSSSNARRLLVVAADVPYPLTNGGRADAWRRLLALKKAGIEIGLVCWYDMRTNYALRVTHDEKLGRILCVTVSDDFVYSEPPEARLAIAGWPAAVWLRAEIDGASLTFHASPDGKTWTQIESEGVVEANGPDGRAWENTQIPAAAAAITPVQRIQLLNAMTGGSRNRGRDTIPL